MTPTRMHEATTELRVRYAETDQMGVVYHANYLVWCDMGRTELLRGLGVSYAELEREGIFLAVSEARLRFHASARYDDRVRVRTRLTRVRSRAVGFSYLIEDLDTNHVLAHAETQLICLDPQGTPRRLPGSIRDLLMGGEQGPLDEMSAGDGTSEPLQGVLDVGSHSEE